MSKKKFIEVIDKIDEWIITNLQIRESNNVLIEFNEHMQKICNLSKKYQEILTDVSKAHIFAVFAGDSVSWKDLLDWNLMEREVDLSELATELRLEFFGFDELEFLGKKVPDI